MLNYLDAYFTHGDSDRLQCTMGNAGGSMPRVVLLDDERRNHLFHRSNCERQQRRRDSVAQCSTSMTDEHLKEKSRIIPQLAD